jgi:hypothetical protein
MFVSEIISARRMKKIITYTIIIQHVLWLVFIGQFSSREVGEMADGRYRFDKKNYSCGRLQEFRTRYSSCYIIYIRTLWVRVTRFQIQLAGGRVIDDEVFKKKKHYYGYVVCTICRPLKMWK